MPSTYLYFCILYRASKCGIWGLQGMGISINDKYLNVYYFTSFHLVSVLRFYIITAFFQKQNVNTVIDTEKDIMDYRAS